jgi:hypothetical protein
MPGQNEKQLDSPMGSLPDKYQIRTDVLIRFGSPQVTPIFVRAAFMLAKREAPGRLAAKLGLLRSHVCPSPMLIITFGRGL